MFDALEYALTRGRTERIKGFTALLLGQADYIKAPDGTIVSTNGFNIDKDGAFAPGSVRWIVDGTRPDDRVKPRLSAVASGALDTIALAFFRPDLYAEAEASHPGAYPPEIRTRVEASVARWK